eukprot:Sspe_Gene.19854::Locus_7256_Transcript_3_4_Confidence_0.700_Length_532::g.19854::m.19854
MFCPPRMPTTACCKSLPATRAMRSPSHSPCRAAQALVDRLKTSYRAEFSAPHNKDLITILPHVPDGLAMLKAKYLLGVLSNSTSSSLKRCGAPSRRPTRSCKGTSGTLPTTLTS